MVLFIHLVVVKYELDISNYKGERVYGLNKDFSKRSDMTLTFDL